MEFAIQASKRGHKVDLYEKTDILGGIFNAATAPSFKEKDRELLAWYKQELAHSPASVHMNTEIKDLSALDADEIVIAIGAHARKLKLTGAERAMTAEDFLYKRKETGDHVIIIGGGLTGCEIAYELALQKKHPAVVEMTDSLVGAKGICSANSTMLRDLLAFHKVPTYLNASVKKITANTVVVETADKEIEIPADSVIMSVGYISNKDFSESNNDKNAKIHYIGDCDKVGNLKTVIKQAYDLAQTLSY